MFKVLKVLRGNCDNNEAHTDTEVFMVEDLITHQVLNLCPKCFLAQMRLRCKGKKESDNGDRIPQALFGDK